MYNSSMRIKPGESMQDWAKRVQQYEYGYALQRIAKGDDHELVMEEMSLRIMQKLVHPVIRAVSTPKEIDQELFNQSKEAYYAKIKRIGPAPDHVVDDLDETD